MATVQASASAAVTACRSCRSLQQQNSTILVCTTPSSQVCRKGVTCVSATNVGFLEARNHLHVPFFVKPRRVKALAFSEFQAVSSEDVPDSDKGSFPIPDTPSSESIPPVEISGSDPTGTSGVPTQLEYAPPLGQDGTQDSGSSATLITGDVPDLGPSAEGAPSVLDGLNSTPPAADAPVDLFKSAGEDGSGEAMLSAQDRYLRAIERNGPASEQASEFDDAIKAAQDSLKAAQDAAQNSVKAAQDAAQDSVKAAQDAAANSVNDLLKSVQDAVDSTTNALDNLGKPVRDALDSTVGSVQDAYESANGSVVKSIKSVTGTADGTQGMSVDYTSVFRVGTPANDFLKEIVFVVKTATASAVVVASDVILQAYTYTKDSVPEDIQSVLNTAEEKISQISGPVGSVINQAFVVITDAERLVGLDPENPIIPVILVLGGSLFLGFGYYNTMYGGYAGDLQPSAALEILKKERNAVLVDIRPQEIRETEGIPDLRRSTRSKFAAIEIVKVEGPLRSLLKNTNEIEDLLTAAVIRNLKNVDRSTKIIVLDADGGLSKQIARGLRRAGSRRAYRVNGGFNSWASSGLRVKSGAPQTPLTILQEDAEAIVEEVKPTPVGVLAGLVGIMLGSYALIEWEKSLELIGLLGLATTGYLRFQSYESAEDVQADLRLLLKPFNLITQGIVSVAGFVEPKKLQLATSPASSNVQGRVIQAAAKHGPISSELELVQDEPVAAGAAEPNDGMDENSQSQHTSLQDPQ